MKRVISSEHSEGFEAWIPDEFSDNTNDTIDTDFTIEVNEKQSYSQAEVEQLLEKTQQEAYQKGLNEGLSQINNNTKIQLEEEIQNQRGELNQLIHSLREPLTIIDEHLEQDILNLVIKIASVLYRREVSINPEQMLAVVKEAKALLPSTHSQVRIHVNPEDAKLLQDDSFELKDDSLCDLFVEDDSLNRGDCRVISDETQVDATLEARINTIIEQVMSHES